MTSVQKKSVLITGKNQRKGGYISLKETTQLQNIKTDLVADLREIDELSDTDSLSELPASVKRRAVYENTYKMTGDKRFPVKDVESAIVNVLRDTFEKEVYDLARSRELSKTSSQLIKERVKELNLPRFKLVVVVHVGENRGHDIEIASRCLWSEELDTYATGYVRNQSLFAQGTVFGVYFE